MRPKLPRIDDQTAYQLRFHDDVWQHAAVIICARHKVEYRCLRRSAQGENIIFLVDESYVIKIFAPLRDNFARETAALDFAAGKLSIRTPALLHTGAIEGWPYLLMTQLAGQASREVWASVGRRDRLEIVTRLGVAMAELHAAAAPLRTVLNRGWQGFIQRQARASVERQRACGANPEWLASLPAYLDRRLPLLEKEKEQVFLHGDIHAGNLLLRQAGGRWSIEGLIDFGDSLCGLNEYEFVAPGVLMIQGDGELQRALLMAYGYAESSLDPELRARLMLLTILYECSDLRKYALRLAPEALTLSLDELERAIWAFATG